MKTQFKKIRNTGFFILFALIAVSCVPTRSIQIEIPKQAKNELPLDIQSLLLVTRTVDNSYSNLKTDSLQNIFYKQKFDYDTVIKDVQAVDTLIKAMGDLLFESGRYDVVIPENRFLPSQRNAYLIHEMPWEEVDTLCKVYDTDALLSLDYFNTRVMTSYGKNDYYSSMDGNFYSYSEAEIKISYEALIRIYDPLKEKVLLRKFYRDTIYWSDMGNSARDLFSRFTPVKQALTETGIAVAIDLADEISTVWRTEHRAIFYKGDPELKHAADLVNANEWEQAMALWRNVAEKSKSKAVKSKAEMNLAVGYEIQGNLDEAISWAVKSYETMFRTNTYYYLEILKRRKNEQKKQ